MASLTSRINYSELTGLLSKREIDVFVLMTQGLENKAISQKLGIGIKTVESHKENIKHKFGVSTIKDLYHLDSSNILL